MTDATPNIDQGDRPIEDYSLPILWQRIAELEAENHTFRMAQKACETCDAPTMQHIKELEAECKRLRSIIDLIDPGNLSHRIAELEARLKAMEQAYKEGITYGQYKEALGGDDGCG